MAISKAEKAAYADYVKEYKHGIDASYKEIKGIEAKIKEMPRISGYLMLEEVNLYFKTIDTYIRMSDASLKMLQIKNERYLDNARKEIYKIIQIMEEIFGNDIDRSLRDNEDYLALIDRVTPLQMLRLIQQLLSIFNTLVDRMGKNSKWKWSFVDLQGRVAVIIKNAISFSDIQKYRDPRTEFYKERQQLLKICKSELNDAAKQFRNKYEMSTKVPSDILKSIELLSVLRKIYVLFSESDEAEKLRNTIDALRVRLEAEEGDDESKKKKK